MPLRCNPPTQSNTPGACPTSDPTTTTGPEVIDLPLDVVARDDDIDPRDAFMYPDAVADYCEAMQEGAEFPPVVVFYDGETYWLADGFLRVEVAYRAEMSAVRAEVRLGTRQEARIYSAGANAHHGQRLNRFDQRRLIARLLEYTEWAEQSDRAIARHIGCSHPFVGKVRAELASGNGFQMPRRRTVYRGGQEYELHLPEREGRPSLVPARSEEDERDATPRLGGEQEPGAPVGDLPPAVPVATPALGMDAPGRCPTCLIRVEGHWQHCSQCENHYRPDETTCPWCAMRRAPSGWEARPYGAPEIRDMLAQGVPTLNSPGATPSRAQPRTSARRAAVLDPDRQQASTILSLLGSLAMMVSGVGPQEVARIASASGMPTERGACDAVAAWCAAYTAALVQGPTSGGGQ